MERAVGTVAGVEGEIHVARVGLGAVDDEEARGECRAPVGDVTGLLEPSPGLLPARDPVPGEVVEADHALPLSRPVPGRELRGVARALRRLAEPVAGIEGVQLGIGGQRIRLVGHTRVDAVQHHLTLARVGGQEDHAVGHRQLGLSEPRRPAGVRAIRSCGAAVACQK